MTEQEVIEWLDAKQIPVYNGSIMESMGRSIGCRVVRLSELAVALSSPHPEAREEDIEKAAVIAHEQWSGWMRYMFAKMDGNVMPQWAMDRWKRQMNTCYENLPESEKESDRAEARKYIDFLSRLAAPKPEGQMRKPANPKNPCADCKNGIGPRPDAICDECEGDESELPSKWEPAAPEPRPEEPRP